MGEVFDITSYLRFAVSLVAVLALILVTAHGAKRLLHGRWGTVKKSATRRLSINEVLPIDARHRLVLVQRDGHEHLILIGPNGDTVVESDIEKSDTQSGVAVDIRSHPNMTSGVQSKTEEQDLPVRPAIGGIGSFLKAVRR